MAPSTEEEKKSGDEKSSSDQNNDGPTTTTVKTDDAGTGPAPTSTTRPPNTTLKPRTTVPELGFEGSALEALLSKQGSAVDTVKAKNVSSKPRHQRGVSWDLGIPPSLSRNDDGGNEASTNAPAAKPSLVNRGVSVPVAAATPGGDGRGKPPIPGGGKSNRLMTDRRPSIVGRKSSNNDSSLDSARSPVRSRLGSLGSSTDLELEAESVLDAVNKDEVAAETYLMRQLDEKDPLHRRAGTGASIFSEVPMDEIQHNFVVEDKDGLVLSPKSQQSDKESTTSRSKANKKLEKPTLQRNMTVEQTLFGLTSALSEMKANDQFERGHHGYHESHDTHGSNDVFDVAGALFDRANKKKAPSKEPVEDIHDSPRPRLYSQDKKAAPSSRWGAIKNNLGDLKKADDSLHNDMHSSSKGDVEEAIQEGSNDFDLDYSEATSEGSSGGEHTDNPTKKSRFDWMKRRKKVNPFRHLPYANKVKEEWDVFNKFLNPRKQTLRMYAKNILMYIMIPSLCIAVALFYLGKNRPYGKCPVEGCDPRKDHASPSWWILFIGCRQVVIVCLSKLFEVFFIDFLALRTQFTLRLFGPMVTLLLVQSRGWPFLLISFGMFNFALTVGDSAFSNHWLYWQPYVGLFNKQNPPGHVTSSLAFYRICAVAMAVGAAVAVKRLAIGVYLGRKTFANYSQSLTSVMNKMLQLNELARFGKVLEENTMSSSKKGSGNERVSQVIDKRLHELIEISNQQQSEEDNLTASRAKSIRSSLQGTDADDDMDRIIDPSDIDPYTGSLSSLQKQRIHDLLGQWEEPARHTPGMSDEVASVGAVMQFKRALAHMDTDFPFGGAFGVADTREACVQCSQNLYDRLMLQENGVSGILHFNAIALIAMDRYGDLDTQKTKDLIRIFRPDREGAISMVDFVRSIDNVYKELRLLRATVAGSTKIDRALESIFNYAFYVVLVCIILWVLDIDPFALFISLSSIVLAFAFMIGSASSKYFEGLLLIVVQRPYGIGDRINIANTEVVGDTAGSQGWIVEDVTLFTTTLCLAATSERATVANGMLAKSRIINGARSPNAIVYVVMRFGIETPYRKVETFRLAVEKFVRARPREWSSMLGFRVSRLEADLGFIEYSTALRHREAWQNIVPILNSRNTMHAFCLELAKKLDMRYKNPPLPVDLRMQGQIPPQFDLKFNDEELAGENTRARNGHSDPTHSPGSLSYNSESLAQVAAMFDD